MFPLSREDEDGVAEGRVTLQSEKIDSAGTRTQGAEVGRRMRRNRARRWRRGVNWRGEKLDKFESRSIQFGPRFPLSISGAS